MVTAPAPPISRMTAVPTTAPGGGALVVVPGAGTVSVEVGIAVAESVSGTVAVPETVSEQPVIARHAARATVTGSTGLMAER
ncbi:hypothetical protein GCM10009581_02120 [Tsukamurella strandjordii]